MAIKGYNSGFMTIGIVLNDLSAGQIPYTIIYNTNKWLRDNFGTVIYAFVEESSIPCVVPIFPRFNISELAYFNGPIIYTSLETTQIEYTKGPKYFYVPNVEEKDSAKFKQVLGNSNITKIYRSKDHSDKLGALPKSRIMRDFNIDELLEIINDNQRN